MEEHAAEAKKSTTDNMSTQHGAERNGHTPQMATISVPPKESLRRRKLETAIWNLELAARAAGPPCGGHIGNGRRISHNRTVRR